MPPLHRSIPDAGNLVGLDFRGAGGDFTPGTWSLSPVEPVTRPWVCCWVLVISTSSPDFYRFRRRGWPPQAQLSVCTWSFVVCAQPEDSLAGCSVVALVLCSSSSLTLAELVANPSDLGACPASWRAYTELRIFRAVSRQPPSIFVAPGVRATTALARRVHTNLITPSFSTLFVRQGDHHRSTSICTRAMCVGGEHRIW